MSCKSKTSKGKTCKRKSIGTSNYCKVHSKKILDEIEKAQRKSEEYSSYARDLYKKFMEGDI